MNILLIQQLIQRWRDDSPKFFVVLQWIFGVIALLCFGVGYVLGYLEICPQIKDLVYNIGAFSIGITLTGKITRK